MDKRLDTARRLMPMANALVVQLSHRPCTYMVLDIPTSLQKKFSGQLNKESLAYLCTQSISLDLNIQYIE